MLPTRFHCLSRHKSIPSLFVGNGARTLAILFVWRLLFPTRTAECTLTYIAVEAVRAIKLASIAMAMTFFLNHRGPDRLLSFALSERTTARFSDLFGRCMESVVTEAL